MAANDGMTSIEVWRDNNPEAAQANAETAAVLAGAASHARALDKMIQGCTRGFKNGQITFAGLAITLNSGTFGAWIRGYEAFKDRVIWRIDVALPGERHPSKLLPTFDDPIVDRLALCAVLDDDVRFVRYGMPQLNAERRKIFLDKLREIVTDYDLCNM